MANSAYEPHDHACSALVNSVVRAVSVVNRIAFLDEDWLPFFVIGAEKCIRTWACLSSTQGH
jgi:hypothetical protein